MKYIVIAICILLILLALYIFARHIKKSLRGGCCESCKGCKLSNECENSTER